MNRHFQFAFVFLTLVGSATFALADRVNVSISGLKYSPGTVEVKVGDTVTWTNNDDREHTVTADDGSFESGTLKKGRTFSKTFSKPGSYAYGSDPSPRTRGVVVVAK
ncbi:cupredoxin domain-containing protein [Humisphaera borealis]|uniref:Cupredoxin domain-containing protein n=1 Tax=Humisphaera borealis TaxID=2807512 RepID=A0A7M2WZ02_9BACT|nr:cupredoxin domain-containing protein [Humisphaera borealis]QOV90706.1 cupredoxin domain-containing protein [Humisphaera borealis]